MSKEGGRAGSAIKKEAVGTCCWFASAAFASLRRMLCVTETWPSFADKAVPHISHADILLSFKKVQAEHDVFCFWDEDGDDATMVPAAPLLPSKKMPRVRAWSRGNFR